MIAPQIPTQKSHEIEIGGYLAGLPLFENQLCKNVAFGDRQPRNNNAKNDKATQ
jgi:hypothetical protein